MMKFDKSGCIERPVALALDEKDTGTTDLLVPLTIKQAKKLRMELNEAIEWAINMEDVRKYGKNNG